ncbi:hypothetical protein CPB85DRAFT_1439867 [Mucidula mucida]|nr:hypothetical protein CPB85DRAFT_1439867 [Mucidula mucida]
MSTKRVACITGAAQGIGRAIALRLADDGCDLSLGIPRRKAIFVIADITSEAEVDNLIVTTVRDLGSLGIMVANAGITMLKSILDTTLEDVDRIHSVNVKGTFICYEAAAKAMIAQGRGGCIIGASSLAGKKGAPMCSIYCGSKSTVRAITQSAAQEWGKDNIRVNAYAPGFTPTPSLYAMKDILGLPIGAYIDIMKKQSALNCTPTPEGVAGLVSFLASDDSKFMTGQTLTIDGGIWFD